MKVAASRFAEFRKGLLRHIKIEEGLLFPERILYPMTDRMVPGPRLCELVGKMKDFA